MPHRVQPASGDLDRWHKARSLLKVNRAELSRAAGRLYPGSARIGASELLGRPEWVPEAPIPLDEVALDWADDAPPPAADGLGPASAHVRPYAAPGRRYPTYAAAIADLDPPALFDNRVCYRLLDARLAGRPGSGTGPAGAGGPGGGDGFRPGGARLSFSRSRFFDAVNLNHALAHEMALAWDEHAGAITMSDLPLRAGVGDPCELARRPAVTAVTTLTLRRAPGGEASFLLHWRDPVKVAHAGGVYQVLPAGIFQPAGESAAAEQHDLSLWRAMAREFSEELLGTSEILAAGDERLDYDRWPLYQRLSAARRQGAFNVWCLAVGVDPLSMATDVLTVAVIDASLFDDVFAGLVEANEEGLVVREGGSAGIPFTAASVARFTGGGEPMQAAGAALLQLAWRHRELLLG